MERSMGMYPDEETPNDCIHTIHNLDLPPLFRLLPLKACHEKPAQGGHRQIRSIT
jgi:hypothetical protein